MSEQQRNFTRELKVEAVRRIDDQGKSLAEVAREPDQTFPGKDNPPADEEELRQLRAEVKRITIERDVLKMRRPLRQEARERGRVPT